MRISHDQWKAQAMVGSIVVYCVLTCFCCAKGEGAVDYRPVTRKCQEILFGSKEP